MEANRAPVENWQMLTLSFENAMAYSLLAIGEQELRPQARQPRVESMIPYKYALFRLLLRALVRTVDRGFRKDHKAYWRYYFR